MNIDDQQRKQLQGLQKDIRWLALEKALEVFIREEFTMSSIKRESEFETIWQSAEAEGGKNALIKFFHDIEEEAKKV
jgi:hypothetical protein